MPAVRLARRARAVRAATAPLCAALACAAAGALAAAPRASAVTFGSSLAQPADWPFGCEARPYPGLGGMQLIATGVTSCMWWPAPLTAASTYVPRGEGRVVAARVRSGANPAPLRIAVISSGGGLCCTARAASAVFQPAADAVTTVPLDLPASAGLDPNRPGSQFNDIVVVSAVGPGRLPVHDLGAHNTFNTSIPAAAFLHPELTNGNSNTDVGWMDGFEVLLQVDWEPNPPAGGGGGGAGGGGGGTGAPGGAGGTGGTGGTGGGAGGGGTGAGGGRDGGATAPRLSGLRIAGRTLTVIAPAAGRLSARFERCTVRGRGRSRRTVCATAALLRTRASGPGPARIALPRSLRAGRYRVTVNAADSRQTLVKRLTVNAAPTRARVASR